MFRRLNSWWISYRRPLNKLIDDNQVFKFAHWPTAKISIQAEANSIFEEISIGHKKSSHSRRPILRALIFSRALQKIETEGRYPYFRVAAAKECFSAGIDDAGYCFILEKKNQFHFYECRGYRFCLAIPLEGVSATVLAMERISVGKGNAVQLLVEAKNAIESGKL